MSKPNRRRGPRNATIAKTFDLSVSHICNRIEFLADPDAFAIPKMTAAETTAAIDHLQGACNDLQRLIARTAEKQGRSVISDKFECRAGPTPKTRTSPSVCPRCEKIADNLFWAIARHHSCGEADRIFSRIMRERHSVLGRAVRLAPLTQQDLIHHDNARLIEDFDAAMKVNSNVAAFVRDRATQNKEIFKAYDAAKKSGLNKSDAVVRCFDKYGRLPPNSRRGAGSTDRGVLRRHLDKLRKERRSRG